MSRVDYLANVLFPRAVAAGAFGPDAEYESFRADTSLAASSSDQFASDIVFGTVTLTDRRGRHSDLRAVIKFKNANPVMSAMMNMHQKFHNEHAFYAQLLPELARRSGDPAAALALFPRFVYSNATPDGVDGDGEQVIVIADLTCDGYRMSDHRVFLDADHVLLALRKLGALHGLSYTAKSHVDGSRSFVDLCTTTLAETQWFDGHWFKSPRFLSGTGYRGVNALCKSNVNNKYVGRLDRLRSMLDGNSDTMADILRPLEPMAVLCHGDFCRNNLLFRYDQDTGKPVDVIIFDPAQTRYASPAIDLSFFLYMNVTDDDRTSRWDDYMAAYLAGVEDTAPAGLQPPDVDAEMRVHALYGYAHCSFFIPAMVDTKPPDVERLTKCTDDERIELINESGGLAADKVLASIVRHMIDRQYV